MEMQLICDTQQAYFIIPFQNFFLWMMISVWTKLNKITYKTTMWLLSQCASRCEIIKNTQRWHKLCFIHLWYSYIEVINHRIKSNLAIDSFWADFDSSYILIRVNFTLLLQALDNQLDSFHFIIFASYVNIMSTT